MADFYTMELDDVHRLLPPEIFADIGIVVDATTTASTASRCSHGAVDVEELAAHLAGVLGLATRRYQRQQPPKTATTTRATAQGCGRMNGVGGGDDGGAMACYAPAPGFGKNGVPLDDLEAMRRAQRFVPAPRCAAGAKPPWRPRRHGSAGTGVFLPRAEAYQTRASKPPRLLTRKEAANDTTMKQRPQHAVRRGSFEGSIVLLGR